jgi:phosphoglycolate phosphatase
MSTCRIGSPGLGGRVLTTTVASSGQRRTGPASLARVLHRPAPAVDRAVVFDLDGTLLDSAVDIHRSIAHALDVHGHAAPSLAALRRWIGRPLDEVFAAFAPEGDLVALGAAYRRHFLTAGCRATRPFPGAVELLDELRAAGWWVAVATTKSTDGARQTLGQLGLLDRFDHVQGTDGFACKPAPDVVQRALVGLGLQELDPSSCWMVGDTVHDVAAGAAAGLATVAVTHGAHAREELLASAADVVVDDLSTLGAHLRTLA